MSRKWRPPLWFVLGGGLAGTLILSFLGLLALRSLGPQIGYNSAATSIGLAIAALTVLCGWLMIRLLLRPIRALAGYASALRRGDAATPPAHFGTPELRDLGQSVIDMGQTLQNREASIRTYTDHVTHELKTPVTAIRAGAELLTDGGTLSAEDQRIVDGINGAVAQVEGQLAALRAMAAARDPGHFGTTKLADMLGALQVDHPDIMLAVRGADRPVPLAASGLRVVFDHLLGNAVQHGADRVDISVDANAITVADNGPGTSAGNAPRLFEPFFTTRRDDGGTGMGLTICKTLLETHGWTIALLDQDQGFAVRLNYPR